MSIRYLDKLFRPHSVVVFGASERHDSVGRAVFSNLLAAGFQGEVRAINPKYREVQGQPCYHELSELDRVPDLAVICTPPATVPGIIEAMGEAGVRAAVVITAGFEVEATGGPRHRQAMLEAAGRHGIRLLGPNCVGLLLPGVGLNASFAPEMARSGGIACIAQSGGLATSILDWAASRNIGFSAFVSMGNCLDVDIPDVVDYFGADAGTRAILLYVESVGDGRKFLSAARAAARNKPMIVVKSGRVAEGARAALSHTGSLTGRDDVFDAALQRSGALRVYGIEDLFSAAELLAHAQRLSGPRLAILTNTGGAGILATDALILGGGQLAELSEATLERLDACLPVNWSRANPVDIIGDAEADRYLEAFELLAADEGVDAILLVHAPTAMVETEALAKALVPVAREARPAVLGCFLGGESARRAARRFSAAGLASFSTPEDAVKAFLQLDAYHRNQASLTEIPDSRPQDFEIDVAGIGERIGCVHEQGRRWLSEAEAKAVLTEVGIPVVETRIVGSAEDAAGEAAEIGFPVALKVVSSKITHKSDIGGVALDLEGPEAVREAARRIERLARRAGFDDIDGFAVQPMVRRPDALELILGASTDPIFGPVLMFGQGGTAVEVLADHALALPPLNRKLAGELIDRTRVARLMAGYRDTPPVDRQGVIDALLRLSALVLAEPRIESLDINPLLVDSEGIVALDARIELRQDPSPRPRPAIAPYPDHERETFEFQGHPIEIRPIRPEDEPAHAEFFDSLDVEDVRFRFFGVIRHPEHGQIARFTQIDYDREIAFIAAELDPPHRTLGVVRAVLDRAHRRAEFAVVVRSAIKGGGLGKRLLVKLIDYCRRVGVEHLVGQVMQDNTRMLSLARELGFELGPAEEGVHSVVLELQPD
ncbi:bifunctional acetate--CoA ligase family protein/GNAT family N-acetyltransferase [Wenzhouxiangella marina]|uniref:CoA-binding domain protein n=1 Tax=Wenzhouxiangella marina TaxID=1579979 RepID=A0A0K0XUP8_9GAMM|nr:bifunctional acetate--CoA ligase family protein/GNAT family N-acetyltransferase [Wenzhouxiangella marina]AKS41347.1 CoA-binding domain protein [Wenzhouxiangella marina]MBB6086903.1 acetyltransferase [Wenzhouxiangella marina]